MKNKILCIVVIFLSVILAFVVSLKKETNFSFEEKEDKIEEIKPHNITVMNPNTNQISVMNIEDYIIGVIAAEMPASFEIEALKSQAVAARTYAVYKQNHRKEDYDITIGTNDQAYNTKEEMQAKWTDKYQTYLDKITKAVEETKGEVLTYQNEVIESFYFSMSNGYTEDSELVFQTDLPYIKSVESAWDNSNLKNYEVTKEFTKDEFCKLLNISCEQIEITDINRTESGRINTLKINNQEWRGVNLRKILNLRSTDFDINIEEKVKITTRGSGHGVGMSQYGANGMAKEGKNYQEILKYFYQNIEISKI